MVGAAGSASLVQPRTKRNVILGLIVGLALGIALAFIREALDTRVRSADELRARLGMPLLGQVPKPDRRPVHSQQLATLTEPTSASTEAFRIIKNRLEFSQLEHGVGSIVITSPRADEAKSTAAANLAVVLAQSGQHVILVDLNLRDPSVDRLFGLPDLGFTDVATGVELTDALNIVDIYSGRLDPNPGRLEVLTAGEPPPDPGEFLLSSFATEALAVLDKRCDVLLIDTPPVLAVGDAMTIAKHTDAVILVAGVNRVRRETLIETRDRARWLRRDETRRHRIGWLRSGARQLPAALTHGVGGRSQRIRPVEASARRTERTARQRGREEARRRDLGLRRIREGAGLDEDAT